MPIRPENGLYNQFSQSGNPYEGQSTKAEIKNLILKRVDLISTKMEELLNEVDKRTMEITYTFLMCDYEYLIEKLIQSGAVDIHNYEENPIFTNFCELFSGTSGIEIYIQTFSKNKPKNVWKKLSFTKKMAKIKILIIEAIEKI